MRKLIWQVAAGCVFESHACLFVQASLEFVRFERTYYKQIAARTVRQLIAVNSAAFLVNGPCVGRPKPPSRSLLDVDEQMNSRRC
jgi:hypothetical protein